MSSLVLELQKEAMDNAVPIGALLRKALLVSRKLSASDIEQWVRSELDGYANSGSDIPDYREVSAQLKVHNPYHGLQPLNVGDDELAKHLSRNRIGQSAPELHELIQKNNGSMLMLSLSPGLKNRLMNAMEYPMEPVFTVSPGALVGILEVVRTRVLDWALALEQKGVLGEGLSFSPKEVAAAPAVNYVITNNIGAMHNSQLQQHSPGGQSLTIGANIADLVPLMETLIQRASELAGEAAVELQAEARTVVAQAASPKPKEGIIREAVRSIRAILENAAGSGLASDVLPKLIVLAGAAGIS